MTDIPYKAPALEKGLDILESLAGVRAPQSVSDIARNLGRSRSEIYRMVVVLEARGYVERTEDPEKLQLSNRLFEIGMRSPPKMNLHDAALPEMSALASSMMQSIQLAVVSSDQIVVIARTESPDDVGALAVSQPITVGRSSDTGWDPHTLKDPGPEPVKSCRRGELSSCATPLSGDPLR